MADAASGGPLVRRERRGVVDVLVVCAAEVVDAETVERVGRHLRQAIEGSDAVGFVIDLGQVRFLTSAALGFIIHLRAQLAERGRTLVLAGAAGDVAHVLECTRLAEVVRIYPSVEDGVRELGGQGPPGG
jgi:anti-sigma B factor antagonist